MIADKLYHRLKALIQVILPGIGTSYVFAATIWDLPHGEEVLGTIVVLELVLGLIVSGAQAAYSKQIGLGDLMIEQDSDGQTGMRLALDHTPEELATKKEVRFRVKRKPTGSRS